MKLFLKLRPYIMVILLIAVWFIPNPWEGYHDQLSLAQGGLEGVVEEVEENQELIEQKEKTFQILFPIKKSDCILTSPFGMRVSPIYNIIMDHKGVDIVAATRAQIIAVADGVIQEHYPPPDGYFKGHKIYGGMILVDHGAYKTLYAHMSKTYIKEGDIVKAGQVIGRQGSTGLTTRKIALNGHVINNGEHLHFELLIGDEYQNSLLYFDNSQIKFVMD